MILVPTDSWKAAWNVTWPVLKICLDPSFEARLSHCQENREKAEADGQACGFLKQMLILCVVHYTLLLSLVQLWVVSWKAKLLCFDAQIWSGHPGGLCLRRNARSKANAAPNHGRLGIWSENTILIVMAISFMCMSKECTKKSFRWWESRPFVYKWW